MAKQKSNLRSAIEFFLIVGAIGAVLLVGAAILAVLGVDFEDVSDTSPSRSCFFAEDCVDIIDFSCSYDDDDMIVSGIVKNVHDSDIIRRVRVLGLAFSGASDDPNKVQVGADSDYAEYEFIAPGQTSPFRIKVDIGRSVSKGSCKVDIANALWK